MKGVTIWFTGSKDFDFMLRLAQKLKDKLSKILEQSVDILDEREIKEKLCSNQPDVGDLNTTVLLRLGWLCKKLVSHDVIVIVLSFSPKREVRDNLRGEIGNFIELFIDEGDLEYEPPYYPEVTLTKKANELEKMVDEIVSTLKNHGYIIEAKEVYSQEEAEKIRDRLEKLGYL